MFCVILFHYIHNAVFFAHLVQLQKEKLTHPSSKRLSVRANSHRSGETTGYPSTLGFQKSPSSCSFITRRTSRRLALPLRDIQTAASRPKRLQHASLA